MKEFFKNVLNYPKYLIVIVVGIFTAALQPLAPFLKKPVTAIALFSAVISGFIGLYFVLKAMLGIEV
ncbi:Protein of unknown function (DUF751) [Synechococcus sp. PCC 7502]|uniref:DUF751 family protein n=1 Tax=Synechococcus sp. PCC 7502 TaxID=1173263 RepID=UPI00029FBA97|nr:DUF751 family protein [Synechococcus sp. PCC 7502]AFY72640.1 Protein of unknown function (DUF751) [Synechococcus sp. PCC 7502]